MNEAKRDKTKLWVARICSLIVMMSAFYSNDAIDHDQLAWHQKVAWGIVFAFALFGSITWMRSTYTPAELKATQESRTVRVFWWILIGVLILLMLVLTLGRYIG